MQHVTTRARHGRAGRTERPNALLCRVFVDVILYVAPRRAPPPRLHIPAAAARDSVSSQLTGRAPVPSQQSIAACRRRRAGSARSSATPNKTISCWAGYVSSGTCVPAIKASMEITQKLRKGAGRALLVVADIDLIALLAHDHGPALATGRGLDGHSRAALFRALLCSLLRIAVPKARWRSDALTKPESVPSQPRHALGVKRGCSTARLSASRPGACSALGL